jgi:hypothetical protein
MISSWKHLSLFVIILCSCSRPQFQSISKELSSMYTGSAKHQKSFLHDARMRLYKMQTDSLNNVISSDTFFLLENLDIENGIIRGNLWSKKGSISYQSNVGKVTSIENPFSLLTRDLVAKWDTSEIKLHELSSIKFIHSDPVFAARFIKGHRKVQIDTLTFERLR